MRLRLTVRRHSLPDTPVVWVVDTSSSPSPTISQLLEAVNEAIPIESEGDWGLEDYAVELKGPNGANYECLHFQHVAAVMKEDDEVIIRPLLTQDLKVRRVTGRRQISAEGKHLFDGLAFGRPLLRRPADRPPITIPPRKRRRVTNDDEEQDEEVEEDMLALMETEEDESDSDSNKQLVLHADFEDEDSEDDEDFVPDEDDNNDVVAKDPEEDADENFDNDAVEISGQTNGVHNNEEMADDEATGTVSEEDIEHHVEAEPTQDSPRGSEVDDTEESVLENESEPRRSKIRKLHAAFPKSPMAVCKYVLSGTKGDMDEAYESMARGFRPAISKNTFTESLQDTPELRVRKTRSKAKSPSPAESGSQDNMGLDDDEEPPNAIVHHYDQNGLPPGSIKSGKALSFMAEALHSSPYRPRFEAKRSASVVSNKSVRLALDEGLTNGLTSTPAIDQESQVIEPSEESDSDSEDTSEEDATSSEDSDDSDDSDSSDQSTHEKENTSDNASTSGSDSSTESSSESSSEDESPEESSSKLSPAAPPIGNSASSPVTKSKSNQSDSVPGYGTQATRTRNKRKQLSNALARYKKKGILPAGTTVAELSKLRINDKTSPELALVALEHVRAGNTTESMSLNAESQSEQFQRRRRELLVSLASGGIEIGPDASVSKEIKPRSIQDPPEPEPAHTPAKEIAHSELAVTSLSTAPQQIERLQLAKTPETEPMSLDETRRSSAPEAPKVDYPIVSPELAPASTEPSQSATRRSKLDLGASRRVLFGALGLKAPKTKKDEEQLRANLLRDVRPLVAPKELDPVDARAERRENFDAWMEKVVYRAVECVQEGVELSRPPFPFVQRWDPQQRSNNGKRKMVDKKMHPEYCEEDSRPFKKQKRRKGKHDYAEEQEYLEASYEPSYQEESMELQYDDSANLTGFEEEDIEDEISMQLMNDIEGADGAISQRPDDLEPFPEDPSSLQDLKDGEAEVGMTIAFKMLDMSAATNWQPSISPYRTAIVRDIQDGTLHMTLAMRDQDHTAKCYDEETGERILGKFEMAGDDDMEENDGRLDLDFSDLFEPKILLPPTKDYNDDASMDDTSEAKEVVNFDDSTTLSQQEESAEAPMSHVTETPLHFDAPDSYQPDRPNEVNGGESPLPEANVADKHSPEVAAQETTTVEVDYISNSIPAAPAFVEGSIPTHSAEEESIPHPTKAVEDVEGLQTRTGMPAEPVSQGAKQQIAHLMQDVDFRTDAPSSVLREIQPESVQSTGEVAALEKLLKEMTESSEKAYSPKFNGLGSSPIKKLRESSRTPSKNTVQVADSSPTRKRKEPSHTPEEEPQASDSPNKQPQATWETIDQDYESPTPSPARQTGSSWVTEESQLQPSSPPAANSVKPVSKFKPLSRKPPVGRAQALWEQLKLKEKEQSTDSEDESTKMSPDRDTGFDGTDEKDTDESVKYPKLSVGSSFTSQVADQGRQPDFDFDDSLATDHGTPTAADFDADITGGLSPEPAPERQPSIASAASQVGDKNAVDSESDFEVEPPALNPANGKPAKATYSQLSSSDVDIPKRKAVDGKSVKAAPLPATWESPDPSSDSDFFPCLEALSQQSATIKREKSREKSMNPPKLTNTSKPRSASESRSVDSSDDEDQTTPKAAQKQRGPSLSQPSVSRVSEKPLSDSKPLIPRPSQQPPSQSQKKSVVPPGSQIWDLTQDSSDAEPEPQPEATQSSDIDPQPVRFRKYQLESDDDDDYQDESKWAPKKISTIGGVESRRHTSGGLKASSQASLNTKNRRKTNA